MAFVMTWNEFVRKPNLDIKTTSHTHQNKTVLNGKDVTLTVIAEGKTPVSYLWFKDGEKMLDARCR